jgi:hypothetical protein
MTASRRAATVVTALLAGASLLMVTGAVLARMLVPYALEGHVERLNERNRNSGGSNVWLLELADGRDYFLDEAGAATIPVGHDISKDAWSRTIEVDGEPRPIGWSRASRGPVAWALAVVAMTVAVAVITPRSRQAATPPPLEPASSS